MFPTPETLTKPAHFPPAHPCLNMSLGEPRAKSTQVAEVFGKRHTDVLREIRKIMTNCPESFRERNFTSTFIDVPGPNGAMRKSPCYLMNRDGFSLLAMGFTGPKALKFKLAYIAAFNGMEAWLADIRAAEAARSCLCKRSVTEP